MTRFPVFGHHFPVLEHRFPILEQRFLFQNIIFLFQNVLFCSVLFCPASRSAFWLSRPVLNFGCPGPSRPLARFLACPVVPLSRDNEGTSVPLSRKVALSRPVGNSSGKHWFCVLTASSSHCMQLKSKKTLVAKTEWGF